MSLEACLQAPRLLPDQVRRITKYARQLVGDEAFTRAIQDLVRAKKAQIAVQQYWEQVNRPVEYPRLTAEGLNAFFRKEYAAQNGRPVILDAYSAPVLEWLCLYFADDPRFEALDESYSLGKGILLQGNVGCGKSSWLRVFQSNQKQSYRFKHCPDVAREFSTDGYKQLDRYAKPIANAYRQQFYGQQELGWCFDDLGFETEGRHYGKASNIMTELIQAIYDSRPMRGMVHMTTNLTAGQIEEVYGVRIRSRMRELFNVIAYDRQAPDRRR